MRRWSISLRLTLWFGGIFFLGWLLFGAAMWFNLKSTLTGEQHQTLSRRVDRLQDLLRNNQNENEEDRHMGMVSSAVLFSVLVKSGESKLSTGDSPLTSTVEFEATARCGSRLVIWLTWTITLFSRKPAKPGAAMETV